MDSKTFNSLSEAYAAVYSEAVYGGKKEEPKDTRYTVTAADKKGNTPAYQKYKAGDKRYKAADHMKEGVRDLDPEKGTKERKERLEKKRGMKLDDHPQYKKEEVENVDERYKGKHGQSSAEYKDDRSQGGKMVSGDSKMSGAEYTHGRRVKAANPGSQPDEGGKTKPKSQGKMDAGTRADLQYRKANLKKEELDLFDTVFEILDEEIENALEVMSQLTPDEVQEIAEGDLAAKARAKAVEMGRKRRSSKEYKQGGARGTGKNERAAYNLANKQNTPNADLGRQKEVDRSSGIGGHMKKALATKGKYNYRAVLDKRDPKKNPKHTANQ